jgi:hypothetical protein
VLRLAVAGGEATLVGDDGAVIATWAQPDSGADRPELYRAQDGTLAIAAVDETLTVVRLADGEIVARTQASRIDLPLDAAWTLETAGELIFDEGHTPPHSSGVGFWFESEPPAGEIERRRAALAEAARVPLHRRVALADGTRSILVHESTTSPHEGGEVLLWPPVIGPAGVLLRHARVVDDGNHATTEPQHPWLVRPDGTVTELPFELGVSPLLAWPDGRWLLPGWDTVWRDGYDEPLHLIDAAGTMTPLLVAGDPVTPSRVLRELVPDRFAALEYDPDQDVPWAAVSARLHGDELHLAIEIDDAETDTVTIVAAALPEDGPIRVLAEHGPVPRSRSAVHV